MPVPKKKDSQTAHIDGIEEHVTDEPFAQSTDLKLLATKTKQLHLHRYKKDQSLRN